MTAPTLLISDLHLDASRPDLTAALLRFLREHSGRCRALLILGDLFDAWIGDDNDSALADEVAEALAAFSAAGAEIGLMHGNRDFLLGEHYAQRCGARLMKETEVICSAGEQFLLMHGDTLCTDDTEYLAFREQVRQPAWQAHFLSLELAERRRFAAQAREQSKAATAGKNMDIMDVNDGAVLAALSAERPEGPVYHLIHGHTHRPATHRFSRPTDSESIALQRTVLGDWGETGWFIRLESGTPELIEFDI